jgi:hypothetical protein
LSDFDKIVDAVESLSKRMDSYATRNDIDPAKVKALYDRPGTPGEKVAAAEALRRMGYDPDHMSASGSQPKSKAEPRSTGPKKYRVIVELASDMNVTFEQTVEASDEIDAEAKVRAMWKAQWKVGRFPQTRVRRTTRV